MKRIIYTALAGLALLLTGACQREGTIYDIPSGSECVSFPTNKAVFEMLPEDGNKITVQLWRGQTNGSASVAVNITDNTGGVFSPSKSTFDFADGEGVATIDFTYPDINALSAAGEYTIKIEIADASQVSPSGFGTLNVSAMRKLTPKYVGTGIYYSDWYEEEWEQDIYTFEEAPSVFSLPSCWVRGTDFTFEIVNGKPVWPESFFSGYVHSTYGNVNIKTGDSYIEDGVLWLEVEKYYVSAGSFGSGVEYFVFPEGMRIP